MSKKLNKKKAPLKLVEAVSTKPIKLDLGCGQNPKEGFEGVDLYGDKATHKVDSIQIPLAVQGQFNKRDSRIPSS